MIPAISRDQVEHEARAKILWGDEPETVVSFLRINGVSEEDAYELVGAFLGERKATVRGMAMTKVFFGLALLAIPATALIWMLNIRYFSGRLMAITGAFGVWGAWKILDGTIKLIFPHTHKGDLTETEEV